MSLSLAKASAESDFATDDDEDFLIQNQNLKGGGPLCSPYLKLYEGTVYMKSLSIDIETFSSVNLGKSGVYRYVEAPDFEILLFALRGWWCCAGY